MNRQVLWILFIVSGMLITGTINTIVKKVQNGWMAPGIIGRMHKYNAPWQQSFWMFLGEMLCLIGLFVERWRSRQRRRQTASLILNGDSKSDDAPPKEAKHVFSWLFILPTLCDLGATSLAGIGLLYVPAAAWQMLRGATIVFSGILSVIFLKKKLVAHHWLGMLTVTLGLTCVGATVLLPDPTKQKSDDAPPQNMFALGLILILAGQVLASIQMVVEELFLKSGNYTAFNVVGMEGMFGTLIMGFFVLPLCYYLPGDNVGSYENIVDAFVQVGQAPGLLGLIIAYIFSIAFFNFFGLSVSKTLSTIHRTLIDACRTILVWGVSIILYYAGTSFGEPWGKWSWLQLLGFLFLIVGTALYNGSYAIIKKFVLTRILKRAPAEPREEEQNLLSASSKGKAYQQLVDVAAEESNAEEPKY